MTPLSECAFSKVSMNAYLHLSHHEDSHMQNLYSFVHVMTYTHYNT